MITAYLVDDERPALDRLSRLLVATGRVEILGASADPVSALAELTQVQPDVVFLDIHMPELSGLQLARELPRGPLVVFTTAYDEFALEAFRANSIDYLVKPITTEQLSRALEKIDRFVHGAGNFDTVSALQRIADAIHAKPERARLTHVTSQIGRRFKIVDLRNVTHFFAQEKLTFAATRDGTCVIDRTIAELEARLDPSKFLRVHRAAILNMEFASELRTDDTGRVTVRLKDPKTTELMVARARLRTVKDRLGIR